MKFQQKTEQEESLMLTPRKSKKKIKNKEKKLYEHENEWIEMIKKLFTIFMNQVEK